nr:MAG TPA: hypothetical protein [Bacteriophage sp.]
MWEEQENSAVQLRLKRHGENTKRTVTARPLPQRHFHRETVYLLHKKFPTPSPTQSKASALTSA